MIYLLKTFYTMLLQAAHFIGAGLATIGLARAEVVIYIKNKNS